MRTNVFGRRLRVIKRRELRKLRTNVKVVAEGRTKCGAVIRVTSGGKLRVELPKRPVFESMVPETAADFGQVESEHEPLTCCDMKVRKVIDLNQIRHRMKFLEKLSIRKEE